MKFIIGTKREMTQIWEGDKMVAVTKVSAGPCVVTQVKDENKDGYKAVQVGYGVRKEKNIKKPQIGHTRNLGFIRHFKEFRIETTDLKVGDHFDVSSFEPGDTVKVTGTSKGKGFQGVVKRHGFKGAKTTHGTKDQVRMPGSIGATGPAHVFKGTRMGGRMGGEKTSVANLKVTEVDSLNNILYVSGAIPGSMNGLISLRGDGDIKVVESEKSKVESKEEKSAIATPKSETKESDAEATDVTKSASVEATDVTKEDSEEKKEVLKEIKKEEPKK